MIIAATEDIVDAVELLHQEKASHLVGEGEGRKAEGLPGAIAQFVADAFRATDNEGEIIGLMAFQEAG